MFGSMNNYQKFMEETKTLIHKILLKSQNPQGGSAFTVGVEVRLELGVGVVKIRFGVRVRITVGISSY